MKASELSHVDLDRLVEEVSEIAKVPKPVVWSIPNKPTGWLIPYPLININPVDLEIAGFTTTELKGIVAHELGHIALKHSTPSYLLTRGQNWREEFDADNFAAHIGFGEALRSSLETARVVAKEGDSHSHPALDRRIARLQTQQ